MKKFTQGLFCVGKLRFLVRSENTVAVLLEVEGWVLIKITIKIL